MTLTFVCQACDDSFEVELSKLTEDTKGVKCPNCGKKISPAEADDLGIAIDEVLSQVAALRKRFVISFDVDGEDLPASYDTGAKRVADGDDDEDEDADDDELEEDEPGEEDDF